MKTIDHSKSQIDLPVHMQILNISVNLARLSQWVFEGYNKKKDLINRFLDQTENFSNDLYTQNISKKFKTTLERFTIEFDKLKNDQITDQNKLQWAERALTWANILQHRAKLA